MHDSRLSGRTLFFSAAAAALIASGTAIAQPADRDGVAVPASSVAERSPFFGQWELDLNRMPDSYGPPPKRVTFTFEDAGSGKWRTTVEIVARDDSVRRVSIEYLRDGRAVQGEGDNADADSAAVSAPAPNVLVFSMAKNRHPAGVRTYVVSPDGQEMTESAANVDSSGAPFVRNFHFRRIR
jgi:hypothetical protein